MSAPPQPQLCCSESLPIWSQRSHSGGGVGGRGEGGSLLPQPATRHHLAGEPHLQEADAHSSAVRPGLRFHSSGQGEQTGEGWASIFGAAHGPRRGSWPLGWPSVCLSGALFRPVSRARRKTGVLVRVPTCGRRSVVSSPGRCTALGNAAETWANPQQGGRTPAIPDRRDFNRRGRRGAAVT